VLLRREPLPIEEVDNARVGLGLLEVPAPTQAASYARASPLPSAATTSVSIVASSRYSSRPRASPSGEPVDDARAPTSMPLFGSRLHEPRVGEQAEMPPDRVLVQVETLGELIGRGRRAAPQGLEDQVLLPLSVHALIWRGLITTRFVENTDSRQLASSYGASKSRTRRRHEHVFGRPF
jgi:hypothetical protein